MSKKLMDAEHLKNLAITALEDVKGKNIRVIDVTNHCDFTDIMVFCSGTSNRHVRSLAMSVVEEAKKQGQHLLSLEGEDEGEWVLVDLGDVVVHVMQEEIREFYQVEELWEIQPDSAK